MSNSGYTLRYTGTCESGSVTDDVDISFECDPQPTPSDVGPDQLNLTTLATTMQGNTPTEGTGQWSILSGTGGSIADASNPVSGFTGIEGQNYTLRWSITTACNTSQDDVTISFACPTAEAGPNQGDVPGTTTTLQATAPFVGTGLWTIVTGSGGSIANPSDPVSTFTGIPGYYLGSYTLKWTVTSNCTSVWDQVFINFVCSPMPTPANAGPDQLNVSGVTTTLAGNIPEFGTGTWTIVDESGYGIIAEPNNPSSIFTGINFAYYILQWENVDTCGTTFDEVEIDFAEFSCGNTFQDTRDATVYTTVQIGTQCWMKKNLKYAAGTGACGGSPPDCDLYGRLYN